MGELQNRYIPHLDQPRISQEAPECLEFIVVHELVHLLERKHNQRFITLMDTHLPNWREHREKLNKMPLAFNRWGY